MTQPSSFEPTSFSADDQAVARGLVAIPREARAFQGMRAGIVSRLIANSVDFVVIVLAVLGLVAANGAWQFMLNPTSFRFSMPSLLTLFWIGFGLLIVYLALAWMTTGRTYGDHLMGLRVVNFRGDRLRPLGALVRSLFCSFFPIGIMWVVISRQNRSVQDVVLRTSVIYDWHVATSGRRGR